MAGKIFGIGLNKTGTTTLGAVCRSLGLRTKSWDREIFSRVIVNSEREPLWRAIEKHDAFDDFPYSLLYPELDRRYPGSKFILTRRRSPECWLSSLKAHAMRANPASITHEIVYGAKFPHGRESQFIEYYNAHNEAARAYFDGREEDFFEICWEETTDIGALAAFLGFEGVSGPPPITNKRGGKLVNPSRYVRNWATRLFTKADAGSIRSH